MRNKIHGRKSQCVVGNKQVLHNIGLEIKENRITAIIGPSGCGKIHIYPVHQ